MTVKAKKSNKKKKPTGKRRKSNILSWLKRFYTDIITKRENEYSKRMLTRIVNNAILMMWGTYILAWFGKESIAEALSETIVKSIIAVVVGYLAKSVIENLSKHAGIFGKKTPAPILDQSSTEETSEMNRDC